MTLSKVCVAGFLSFLSTVSATKVAAQDTTIHPVMTSEQKAVRVQAEKDFSASNWSAAFTELESLHLQVPDNGTITEMLAESALNLDRYDYACKLLAPLVHDSPDRWEALALMTRYYAQTQNDMERDAGLAKLQVMHDSGEHPRLAAMDTILLERHTTADGGTVTIWYSLKPWGRFHAYLYARYNDAGGRETSYMTLESSDFDQPLWAKSHPAQAAAGERMFSLDYYGLPIKKPDGSATAFHATMGFFDGKPNYDQIRDRMLTGNRKVESQTVPSTKIP